MSLMLSFIIIFYILLEKIILTSGRFCQLDWPQHLGFLLHLLNPCCSFANKGFILYYIFGWFLCSPSFPVCLQEGIILLWSLLVCLRLYINFSKSEPHLSTFVLRTVLGYSGYVFSLPSDKLLEIWQLAYSLLKTQPVTVYQIMSLLGKPNFCANGHVQHC